MSPRPTWSRHVGPCAPGEETTCLYTYDLTGEPPLRALGQIRVNDGTLKRSAQVAAVGDRAYVVQGSRWTALDLSDPAAPRVVDLRHLDLGEAQDLTVLDDARVLVSGTEQVIVQIDPIVGTFIAHRFAIHGRAGVDGPVGYVAAGKDGLWRLALGAR